MYKLLRIEQKRLKESTYKLLFSSIQEGILFINMRPFHAGAPSSQTQGTIEQQLNCSLIPDINNLNDCESFVQLLVGDSYPSTSSISTSIEKPDIFTSMDDTQKVMEHCSSKSSSQDQQISVQDILVISRDRPHEQQQPPIAHALPLHHSQHQQSYTPLLPYSEYCRRRECYNTLTIPKTSVHLSTSNHELKTKSIVRISVPDSEGRVINAWYRYIFASQMWKPNCPDHEGVAYATQPLSFDLKSRVWHLYLKRPTSLSKLRVGYDKSMRNVYVQINIQSEGHFPFVFLYRLYTERQQGISKVGQNFKKETLYMMDWNNIENVSLELMNI